MALPTAALLLAAIACGTPPSTPPDGSCRPACADRGCGDDGCGGVCGTCPPATACGGAGLCASISCAGGLLCLVEERTALACACTRSVPDEPWQCTPLTPLGWFHDYQACRVACAGGESACHENDSDVGAACRACEASCADHVDAACGDEAAGICPAPCACR
jgi:hypothetical protein